jgi:hypothetical protein
MAIFKFEYKVILFVLKLDYLFMPHWRQYGALTPIAECLICTQKVIGANPVSSTKKLAAFRAGRFVGEEVTHWIQNPAHVGASPARGTF